MAEKRARATSKAGRDSDFEADAVTAFSAVRRALAELVVALPGAIRRPTDLQRVLGVDYKICWEVFTVVKSTDPLASAKHTPSLTHLKRFLAAAQKLKVSERAIDAVQTSIAQFDEVIAAHAEDRSTFDSMVSAVSPGVSGANSDLQQRRTVYRGLSHIWGMQIDVYCATVLVRLNAAGDGTEECSLVQKVGLRRLSPGQSLPVAGYHHHSSAPKAPTRVVREPLDPKANERYGGQLLPAFSTHPLPKLKSTQYSSGWTHVGLHDETIGRRSAVNLAFGGIARNVPLSLDTDDRRVFRYGSRFTQIPTGLFICNTLIHRPSFGKVQVDAMSFQGTPGDESQDVARQAKQLPVWDKLANVGLASDLLPIPEVPRFLEALVFASERVGWNLDEFDAYTLRVAYPVQGSVVRTFFYY